MVLQLKEICLNCVTRNFHTMTNFDFTLLSSLDKEKIIERLGNHNLLSLKNNNKVNFSIAVVSDYNENEYRQNLFEYFFMCNMNSLKFSCCPQLDDLFLKSIIDSVICSSRKQVFTVKSISFDRCSELTGIY